MCLIDDIFLSLLIRLIGGRRILANFEFGRKSIKALFTRPVSESDFAFLCDFKILNWAGISIKLYSDHKIRRWKNSSYFAYYTV
jgi:hypothetical protein